MVKILMQNSLTPKTICEDVELRKLTGPYGASSLKSSLKKRKYIAAAEIIIACAVENPLQSIWQIILQSKIYFHV